MKRMLYLLLLICGTFGVQAQTARLQVIHNSASPTVDIWVNGSKLLSDFKYRTATPFIDVPSNVELNIGVAPSPSSSPADIIATFPVTLATGEKYVALATGLVGSTSTPFGLKIITPAREQAGNSTTVDFAVSHGSTDAPAVDVIARGVGKLVDNAAYGDVTSYISVPANNYVLDVTPAGNSTVVASFAANLGTLGGGAAVVFASGFLAPTGTDPKFGLFAALPNGTVLELPAVGNARLQVIHNSASPTVDIWVNGSKLLSDFKYRTATPFIDVPSNVVLNIGVAPSPSSSPADIIATFPVTLATGEKYVALATGLVGSTSTPFGLKIIIPAREQAGNSTTVDFAVSHGSTDAPAVDVLARGVGKLVSNAAYGDVTSYISVPANNYVLDVTPAGNSTVVASFAANLGTLGGGAAVVFASGFLAPTGTDPKFGLFAALPNGTVLELPAVGNARLQVIHNSASPTVDIWVNGSKLLSDFKYRTATPFIDVPSNVVLNIGVAPSPSSSPADIIATFPVTLATGEKYVALATGLVGSTSTPFGLKIITPAREQAGNSTTVDFAVSHGSTDAPAVDVLARGVGKLVSNAAYGDVTSYISVPANNYVLDVTPAGNSTVVASFAANLGTLGGGAAVVFASGFLAPTGTDPKFGLFAALPNGTVLELPAVGNARLQVIHNSASPTVDIWVNGSKLLSDFKYRTATPFIDVPSNVVLNIGVAPSPSSSPADIIATFPVTLATGEKYVALATGLVGSTSTPFGLKIITPAREQAGNSTTIDFAVSHGSTDAPAVDVVARGVGKLVSNAAYGDVTSYISVPANNYVLDVTPAGNSTVVASFAANLGTLGGGAAVVFASGFLAPTGTDPKFGLFAALPNGTVLELPAVGNARLQVIHNSASPTVDIWVNGSKLLSDFKYRTATPFIDVPSNVVLNIGVAPSPSSSPADIIATFPVTLATGEKYVALATGLVGSTSTPFKLSIIASAKETASVGTNVALNVFHGSTDAPAIDVVNRIGGGVLVTNLSYDQASGYLEVPAQAYALGLRATGNNPVLATFKADVTSLAGGAGVVFASGALAGNPAFGLFVALPNGTVVALPAIGKSLVQIIHNSPKPVVDIYANGVKIIDDFQFRTATPYLEFPADLAIKIGVAPGNSTSAAQAIANFDLTLEDNNSYQVFANGIVGDPDTPFELSIFKGAKQTSGNAQAAVLVHHGSPAIGPVKVSNADLNYATILPTFDYKEFAGYLALPAAKYNIALSEAGTNEPNVIYEVDASALSGKAITLFASGLDFDNPDPSVHFGLFGVTPEGQVIRFSTRVKVQIIHNAPEPEVDIYVNGAKALDNLKFRTATPYILLPGGTDLSIAIAPGTSSSVADAIATYNNVNFEIGQAYTVMAYGEVTAGSSFPFNLAIEPTYEFAANPDEVEVIAFHGSPGAPVVDITLPNKTVLFDDLPYGEFSSEVLSVPPGIYDLYVTPGNNNNTVVAKFRGDLTSLKGQSITVFASGYLSKQPGFGLYAALPNGTVVPLQNITSNEEVGKYYQSVQLNPTVNSSSSLLSFNLTEDLATEIRVIDLSGKIVKTIPIGNVSKGYQELRIEAQDLGNGLNYVQINSSKGTIAIPMVVQK